MIECSSCQTLNPETESSCLACGFALTLARQTGATQVGTSRCSAGHPTDPSWKSCPYCDSPAGTGHGSGAATRLDAAPRSGPPADQHTRLEAVSAGRDRHTRLEGESELGLALPRSPSMPEPTRLEAAPAPARAAGRRTVLQRGMEAPIPTPPAAVERPVVPAERPRSAAEGSTRELLAVLAAPVHGQGGSVFAVRGGKNTVGASRSNDIVLSGDPEVSGEHALILYRSGRFHLADRLSTNGTWLNDDEIPAGSTVPLRDRDRVRCGRTDLVFLVIEPGDATSSGSDDV